MLVGEGWDFTIPEAIHPNDLEISYEVDLLESSIFVTYDNTQRRFTIDAGKTVDDDEGIYQI